MPSRGGGKPPSEEVLDEQDKSNQDLCYDFARNIENWAERDTKVKSIIPVLLMLYYSQEGINTGDKGSECLGGCTVSEHGLERYYSASDEIEWSCNCCYQAEKENRNEIFCLGCKRPKSEYFSSTQPFRCVHDELKKNFIITIVNTIASIVNRLWFPLQHGKNLEVLFL